MIDHVKLYNKFQAAIFIKFDTGHQNTMFTITTPLPVKAHLPLIFNNLKFKYFLEN